MKKKIINDNNYISVIYKESKYHIEIECKICIFDIDGIDNCPRNYKGILNCLILGDNNSNIYYYKKSIKQILKKL